MNAAPAETGSQPLPAGVKRVNIPGVNNAFAIGTNLFSGSTPETEESFSALERLGVKTVISVDGAPPDANAARHHGIRYVHLPCGYDGISSNRQHQLANAAATLPGPIFVHCHHGAHRGPAAAAILAQASKLWTPDAADEWLHVAGTGTNYLGLYASVRNFRLPPSATLNQLPIEFPERASSTGLVDTMVEIDRRWESLKVIDSAGAISTPTAKTEAGHQLTLLKEHFREAQRLEEAVRRGPDFLKALNKAESLTDVAAQKLGGSGSPALANRAIDAIRANCNECHRRYRDQ